MIEIVVFFCSFIAFSISAICGGGAGLILIPILNNFLSVNQIPATLAIGTFAGSASRIIAFKKHIHWHIVKYFLPMALPSIFIGAWLLKWISPIYIQLGMAIYLISNIPFLFIKSKQITCSKKTSNLWISVIGFMAGFVSGFTGPVGLLFNRFYLRYGLTNEQIIATRAANEIILHLIKIILYSLFGLISMKVLYIGIAIALSSITATFAIQWILPKISEFVFKKIGYFAMISSGFIMLYDSGKNIWEDNYMLLSTIQTSKKIALELKSYKAGYAMEFTYDEGVEFEQIIPFSQLPPEYQTKILTTKNKHEEVIVEAVYQIGKKSYETYFFDKEKLV